MRTRTKKLYLAKLDWNIAKGIIARAFR